MSYLREQLIRTAIRGSDVWGRTFKQKKPPRLVTQPQSICLIALHQMGDCLLCCPTMQAIRNLWPQAELTIIVSTANTELMQLTGVSATIVGFDAWWQRVNREVAKKTKDSHEIKAAKRAFKTVLSKINPDVALAFHPDRRVNEMLGQSGIPHTFGFTLDGGGFNLTHPVPYPEHGHQIMRNFALAETLAAVFNRPKPALKPVHLHINPSTVTETKQLLQKNHVATSKMVVIHPFSSTLTKNWPSARWAEVLQWLGKQGYNAIIIGGRTDLFSEAEKRLFPVLQTTPSLAGKCSLPQTAALLSVAQLFIGIDSGPGHLAVAINCPIVSIFSSVNDPQQWQVHGGAGKTIVLHKPVQNRQKFPLHQPNVPSGTLGNPYIDRILAADVIIAAQQLLSLKSTEKGWPGKNFPNHPHRKSD